MNKIFTSLLVFSVLTSCSSLSVNYSPITETSTGGYKDTKYDAKTMSTRFVGNMFTEPKNMVLFAQFRSLEVCRNQKKNLARVLMFNDLSPSKNIQEADGYKNLIPEYLAENQAYSKYQGTEISNGSINPIFETIYNCTDKVFDTQLDLKDVKPEDAKLFVKDLKGAVQIENIPLNSINSSVVRMDDIIIKVNGERTKSRLDFYRMVDDNNGQKLTFTLYRDGSLKEVLGSTVDVTNIASAHSKKIQKLACEFEELKARTLCE